MDVLYPMPWNKFGHRIHYHRRMAEHHKEAAEKETDPSAKALHQHEQWRHFMALHGAHRRAVAKAHHKIARKYKRRKSKSTSSDSDSSSSSSSGYSRKRRARARKSRSRKSRKSRRGGR